MTRKVHRGRKGDGWPKRGQQPVIVASTATLRSRRAIEYPDVCPQHARCGHVVCSIVWYCVEAG